ncbi:hypothetical protein [Porphyromonas sp.]
MYPSTSQRATLLLAVILGASSCRTATQRTKTEHEDTHRTHSTLQHSSERQQQAQSFDTLTLELTEEVHPLTSFAPLTFPSPHEDHGWVAHYHLREIAHRHSSGTDSLHERDSLQATTHTISHTITAHKAPTSPLRPFAIGVSLLLLLWGAYTLLYRRTQR